MMKKISLIALSLVVMLGLSGCKVPFTDKEISLPFGDKSPEVVMDSMYDKMMEMKTSEFEGKYEIGFKIDPTALDEDSENLSGPATPGMPDFSGPLDMTMYFDIVGKSDMSDKEKLKTEGNVKMSFDMGGMEFKLDYDMVMVDENMFFKVNKMPLPVTMMVGNQFIGDWWELNMEEMEEMQEELVAMSGEELDTPMYDFQENQEKMIKIQGQMYDIVKKHNVLKVDEEMDDEKIDGEKHYHYKVSLNTETIDDAAKEILDLLMEEFDEEIEVAMEDVDEEVLDKVFSQISNVLTVAEGEIWINKDSYYITKSNLDLAIDMSKLDPELIDDEDFEPIPEGAFEISIKGDTKYSNINEPVEINVPEDAESFVDYMEQMMQASMTNAANMGAGPAGDFGGYESMYGIDPSAIDAGDLQGLEDMEDINKMMEQMDNLQ